MDSPASSREPVSSSKAEQTAEKQQALEDILRDEDVARERAQEAFRDGDYEQYEELSDQAQKAQERYYKEVGTPVTTERVRGPTPESPAQRQETEQLKQAIQEQQQEVEVPVPEIEW